MSFALSFLLIILAAILVPKSAREDDISFSLVARSSYVMSIALIAGSPVLALYLGSLVDSGNPSVVFFKYLWIGFALSLPASLGFARLFGRSALEDFWKYLDSFSSLSRSGTVRIWAIGTSFLLIAGLIFGSARFR
jgi:hypothetical protein